MTTPQGYIPDPDEPYSDFADEAPTSLREQIREALISQHTDPNYAEWDTIIDHDVDQIMLLVTTYIEAAEIDRAIKEVQWFIDELWSKDVRPDEIYPKLLGRAKALQARKAVLEDQDE